MPKKQVEINKTNQARIDKWIRTEIAGKINEDDVDPFAIMFNSLVLSEVKNHKECTEKSVVAAFIDSFTNYIKKHDSHSWEDIDVNVCIGNARKALAVKYTSLHNFTNNIDIYFNDVKREYILHPMNESYSMEFLPENRDIFIKNNLKLVVNCAKRYRNLGIPFEDLIQTGNYGLLVAFNKFDKNRATLRTAINENIEKSKKKSFTNEDARKLVSKSFIYDKDLDRTLNSIPAEGFDSKDAFYEWVKANVKTAVFASVAYKWITAYILMELTNMNSAVRTPKKAKKEFTEDEMIAGVDNDNSGATIVSLDSVNPHTNDNYHDNQMSGVAMEQFTIEDNKIDNQDNDVLFHEIISKAIANLSDINRRIIKKRYGIGFPTPLNINDIAESEGIAVNRVKYIISLCLQELAKNISTKDKMILAEVFGRNVDED